MIDATQIKEHAEIISADGLHVGTVDRVEGSRIKLTKKDSGAGHQDHHHFIELDLVESVDGNRVRLTAKGAEVTAAEEEGDGSSVH
ncbi:MULTISPECIES: DUF2171 domain-containing protein [unclassified Rhizobium]|uniref:DUF2171 domain-containing protein n=1 Tax=unclassified Rhizobium TaxID=2613769 RepID=UPI0007156DE9|nr:MULTISPECIES: DUF2171 domain-containing protein [unclassified Rhizobium]KQS84167.1 hypothetical protein ASG50_30240 [Rhizobium sp. Leaf386]KQT00792.1 hypothetical protein ASG42_27490 [Rhizobium sp. Leaf391]KQU08442.1 hypothetical protein ASG68_22930 [Rhizobium sp. Leaf453]